MKAIQILVLATCIAQARPFAGLSAPSIRVDPRTFKSNGGGEPAVQSPPLRAEQSPPVPGGPPGGTPPGKGPPGGPPKGGPPGEPTLQQKLTERALEIGFSLLYLAEPGEGARDSFKNLRVLWTRAILNEKGRIQDPIAWELLPKSSRWIIKLVPDSVLEPLDWISKRSNFIDVQLDEFLEETSNEGARQVVLLGAGYDTRALRYLRKNNNLDFFEVDLPDISEMKVEMLRQYLGQHSTQSIHHIPFDLNQVMAGDKSLVDALEAAGMSKDTKNVPTMIICEAVLFYLAPLAVQKVTKELFELDATRYCFTDNLSKVGVTPGGPGPPRAKCESWLNENGKVLVEHDAIWGGAIHFVGAKGK